jgi:Putative restriction endonuclease
MRVRWPRPWALNEASTSASTRRCSEVLPGRAWDRALEAGPLPRLGPLLPAAQGRSMATNDGSAQTEDGAWLKRRGGCWTLDEFLAFDDGTDRRYELFDGRIVAMAPVSDVHGALVAGLGAPDRHDPNRFLLTGGGRAGSEYFSNPSVRLRE